jgi:hypothetical protein
MRNLLPTLLNYHPLSHTNYATFGLDCCFGAKILNALPQSNFLRAALASDCCYCKLRSDVGLLNLTRSYHFHRPYQIELLILQRLMQHNSYLGHSVSYFTNANAFIVLVLLLLTREWHPLQQISENHY